jgi:uncharacterized protein (DUF1330 family)
VQSPASLQPRIFNETERDFVVPAYAVGHLHNVNMGPAILEYLQRIDATLKPFGGLFIIHGGPVDRLEGHWSGDLIVIQFPDRDAAHAWYASPAYQAIVRLRTENSEGDVFIIDGVTEEHRAADILTQDASAPARRS